MNLEIANKNYRCAICHGIIYAGHKCWKRGGGIYTSHQHTNCVEHEAQHAVTERKYGIKISEY